jgi:imidazolonepropionase-like amidohydrolase
LIFNIIIMQKLIFFLLLILPLRVLAQQDNAPVIGVSDKRVDVYGLRNARVIIDYQTTLENADILISAGRIQAVGQNLAFPKGTIIFDLTGKTVYPSFIDAYAPNYGIKTQSGKQDANPFAAFMNPGRRGSSSTPGPEPRVADYWNDGIHASYDVLTEFMPDSKSADEYRQAGFGAVLTFKATGIARGTSAVVSTGEGKTNNLIIKSKASANYSLIRSRSADLYPASQFGIIALLRQVNYDAQWYKQLPPGYFHDDGLEAYTENLSLPQIFEVGDKLEILRAGKIGKEFGIDYIIKGAGDEYQTIADLKQAGNKLIIPLNFPEAPDVKDPFVAATIPYRTLKHYEFAPANLSMVSKAGLTFALTSSDLKARSSFLANLRKSVKYGLAQGDALKALTFIPASILGVTDLVGAIKKNMFANLLITSGDIFSDECVVYENWVQGVPYRFVDLRTRDLRGVYNLHADTANYKMTITGTPDKPSVKLMVDSLEIKGATLTSDRDLVSISFEQSKKKFRLSGYISGNNLEGQGQSDTGTWFAWKAEYSGKSTEPEAGPKKPDLPLPAIGKVIYPFTAYGTSELPVQESILIRNATVWTNENEGKLLNTDVLVKQGKIAAVGKNLTAPDGARIIDASGMHLTPGIIDEHSHIALTSINEFGEAIASEVRAEDVIDPEDQSIYQQLAGGVTAAHILHGSADPIGGQSALIKHRWGHNAEDLKIAGHVGFLKHALGENVKRSYNRYPNSRMGVEQIIRDNYQRALEYNQSWKEWNALKPAQKAGKIPPRRDLRLDALVDVLEKRSFIVCHTYVQSEAAMIMNLADEFGVRVNTLIHCNEGYKVADQILAHGAAASVFSDWWDYKYEVYESSAYNASLLVKKGVLTCINSDDAEMGRRLNQEAGKVMKYGGISEIDALKLVTLNPAKILHLDDRMGSIKKGKDADLVLWTDYPLSVYARASKTIVDGTIYYDEARDADLRDQTESERNRIIKNILNEPPQPASPNSKFPKK